MSVVCDRPTDLYLLENALRSTFSVLATHILAGQVDTIMPEVQDGVGEGPDYGKKTRVSLALLYLRMLLKRVWWFLRYFNPLNLAWRYYSILAFRYMRGKLSSRQIALLNFEPFPFKPPMPYFEVEAMAEDEYAVKRLEIAGIFSSQGLLSLIAAYQGMLAVQFTISSSGFGFLPNTTKAMAILGLFRVLVSPWIANKVHVEMGEHSYEYQHNVRSCNCFCRAKGQATTGENQTIDMNKGLVGAWLMTLVCLVGLSLRSYVRLPASSFSVPAHLIDRTIEALYNYVSITALAFHGYFLWRYGAMGLANRHPLFDHWLYHLQTLGFVLFFVVTIVIGLVDFVQHDFYANCFY